VSILKLAVVLLELDPEELALIALIPGNSESRDSLPETWICTPSPPRISLRISSSGFEVAFVVAVETE
jgi:hypothetical protein